MSKSRDNKTSVNATPVITPGEALKKREQMLEQARKEAEQRGNRDDSEDTEDASIATFILPGD